MKMVFNSNEAAVVAAGTEGEPCDEAGATLLLSDLAPGDEAVVVSVSQDTPIARRLLDLGFVPGTPVAVVRRAPLGDPVEFELRGTRLCLRRTETDRIRVQPR